MLFPDESNSAAEFLIEAKKRLFERSRLLSPDATLAAIQDLKEWIAQELAFEESASTSFGRLLSELWHVEYLDQLPPLLNRFERLVSAYFVRRGSVTAFHGFCNAWREGVLQRTLQFAEEGPEPKDRGAALAPYALLVSGSIGRREQTLEEGERYFLVWQGDAAQYFEPFTYRFMAILDQCGLLGKEGAGFLGQVLWRGSLEEWSGYLEQEPRGDHPSRLEVVADLRQVCGDAAVGSAAVLEAHASLERYQGKGEFQELAQRIIKAPVALRLMGGIRVEKSGEHAGCCNPEQSGLSPLVAAVRLLAARYRLEVGPTLERIGRLSALGVLKGAEAERLVASYHELAGLKLRREVALELPFINPADLSLSERRRLREALEAVRQLQRLVRCIFLGKDSSGEASA